MKKIIIIGGGISGLICAIKAKNESNEVILLEKNNSCGKKILLTGNGRCNYFNEDQNINHYHSYNEELLNNFINDNNIDKVKDFWDSIGIVPNIIDNYYYPMSNQATSIKDALLCECESKKIDIINDCNVLDIIKEDNKYKVISNLFTFECDKVVIACGSKSYPKTGSDGSGYNLLKKLDLKIYEVLPSLVQVYGNENYKEWTGIRTKVKLELYSSNELIDEEKGEIQLTDYGISGIVTYNLSGYISKFLNSRTNCHLIIKFYESSIEEFIDLFNERNNKLKDRTILSLFTGLFNYKLALYLFKKAGIKHDSYWNELSDSKKDELARLFTNYEFVPIKTNDFENAQVCSGGLSLEELNNNFGINKYPGLYGIGEIVDIDGDCGGYNITFAAISAILAGEDINND